MVKFEDHQKEDGSINWDSYHKAQVDEGELCYRCGGTILLANLWSKSLPTQQLCFSCRSLDDKSSEEVEHEKLVRCPKCGHQSDVSQWDCDSAEIYNEGEHNVECDSCDHEFQISTRVEYYFTSPLMEKKSENPG